MAEALIRGILEAKLFSSQDITVYDVDSLRLQYLAKTYTVSTTSEPAFFSDTCNNVILAVKPQVIGDVSGLFNQFFDKKKLLISIMAGVALGALEEYFPQVRRFIRVMPNTPALILEGASAISIHNDVLEQDRDIAQKIFSSVGLCIEVKEELLDAVTGLSGSGPGYIFTIIDALTDGGVLAGLPRGLAEKLVLQTMYGSVKLAMKSELCAAELKAQVTSPGGTTIHGIHALEKHNVRAALMDAVMQATHRAKGN